MKTQTKFEIGDNLKIKEDSLIKSKAFSVLRVMEITIQICYTTTQIFYDCRRIDVISKFSYGDKEPIPISGHVMNPTNALGWYRYREDELEKVEKEYLKPLGNKVE